MTCIAFAETAVACIAAQRYVNTLFANITSSFVIDQRYVRRSQVWTSSRWVANFVELEEVNFHLRCTLHHGVACSGEIHQCGYLVPKHSCRAP